MLSTFHWGHWSSQYLLCMLLFPACVNPDVAFYLDKALWDAEVPLKGRFYAVGPHELEWIDKMGERAVGTLTFVRFDPSANISDLGFFNSPKEFTQHLGISSPDFLYPSSAASSFIIMKSIQQAFEDCDILASEDDIDAMLFNSSALR